jgi:hypothetical protein
MSPALRDVIRMGRAMAELWIAGYAKPRSSVVFDIDDTDDTVDVVHGRKQLPLFNAHYDERCFLPIHISDTETARPVAVIVRPGKTPTGVEARSHLRRLIRQVRKHWPRTYIAIRGDGYDARPKMTAWGQTSSIDYVFGLAGSRPLTAKVEAAADGLHTRRALEETDSVRTHA